MKYTIEIPDNNYDLVAEYNHLLSLGYDNLSTRKTMRLDGLFYILLADKPLQPLEHTTVLHWLPANGIIRPTPGKRYLVSDGNTITTGYFEHSIDRWICADPITVDRFTEENRPTDHASTATRHDAFSAVRQEPGYYESTQPYLY